MRTSDIGIIICTRNKVNALKKSVDAIIGFGWEDFELTIIDNNSTDGTRDYCCFLLRYFAQSTITFRFHFEPELGLSKARNTGLRNSFSKWVIFLDDDCIPKPEFLSSYKQMLKENQECKLAGGPITAIWPESGKPSYLPNGYDWLYGAIDNGGDGLYRRLKQSEGINGGNILLHRETVVSLGGFNEMLGHIGDTFGGNEEFFLIETLKEKFPDDLFWCAHSIVEHHFPLDRLNLAYAKCRSKAAGYDRARSDCYKKRYILIALRFTFYLFKYPLDHSTVRKANSFGYLSGSASMASSGIKAILNRMLSNS